MRLNKVLSPDLKPGRESHCCGCLVAKSSRAAGSCEAGKGQSEEEDLREPAGVAM